MTAPITFPSGPMTPLAATRLIEGIDESLSVTSADGSITFYLKGPQSPLFPGIPGQDGIIIQSVDGLSPPFKHKDLQAATEDGVTWTDTVYDPAMITLQGEIHATTPQGLDYARNCWMGMWNPRQLLTMEHYTPEGGFWTAQTRLANTWTGPIKSDRRYLWRPIVHKCRIDAAFWNGPVSTDGFGATYTTFGDGFGTPGALSADWTLSYSPGGHTGSISVGSSGGVFWNDTGNSTQSVEAIYNAQTTSTDYQIITLQMGGAWEGITLGGQAYNDIWARVDGSGNGVLCRIGFTGVWIYRYNSGTPTLMYYHPLIVPPLPNEAWAFFCGTQAGAPRTYAVWRGPFLRHIGGSFILGFAEVGTGSVVGSSARSVGFGMATAGGIGGAGEARPIPVSAFAASDNTTVTQSGLLQLSNIGTEDGWPTYTLTGPGIFGIGDGPNGVGGTVNVGPLGSGQVVTVSTLPRLRSSNQQIMSGRFTTPIPGVAIPSQAQPVQIPVAITSGNGLSSVVATLTPRRIHPA